MSNQIHSTAIIEEGVTLGSNNVIEAFSFIRKGTTIGDNNLIESFTVIGDTPSSTLDAKLPSGVSIGNNNIIGAGSIIQRGMNLHGMTTIGDYNNIYNHVVIGHDCTIGNYNMFNAHVGLTGFITVGNHVTFGPYSGVGVASIEGVNKTVIDSYSFISTYSRVANNVPMLSLVTGGYNPIISDLNKTKLKEVLLAFPNETEETIKEAIKITYKTSATEIIDGLSYLTFELNNTFASKLLSFYRTYRNIVKRRSNESYSTTTS